LNPTTPTSTTKTLPEEILLKLQPCNLAGLQWSRTAPRHRLLGLHGWLDNAATFNGIFPALTDDHAVALDLPGHGRSQWAPPGTAYHFVDAVAAVVDALDALDWKRCVLVGHSLGGGIMPMVAAVVPERVSGLILLDGLGPLANPAAEAPGVLIKALADRLHPRTPRLYADKEQAVQRLLHRDLTEAAARTLAERGLREEPGGWRFSHDPRQHWNSRLRMTEEQVQAFLQRVACPTLLVLASRGPIIKWTGCRNRMQAIADLTTLELVAGHHVHLEEPERVLPEIRKFLDKIR
jgi:pimeloyl-ACP methyl ester carboxylesterase